MRYRECSMMIRWCVAACAMVVLVACGGGGGSGNGSPAMVVVPNVAGDTQAAATTAITGAGLALGTVSTQSSATVTSGNVISETPAAGASVTKGSTVALAVSSGPAMVAVPNVVGDTQAAATTAITGAGLTVGTVTMQSSSTVSSGSVISETPAAGTSVASASAVALVVSTGSSTNTVTLGGIVIGLASGQTVHVLNGSDNVPVPTNGTFTFPTQIATGAAYSVSVGSPLPTGQTCAVQSATGTAASTNITNVVVYCTTNVTAATLTGPYTAVTDNLSTKADALDSVIFDAVSSYSGSATQNVNGTISTPSVSGSYTVAPTLSIPVLAFNGTDYGALEFNANAVALLTNATGGTPGLFFGVKQAQNASISTINGSYTMVSLESTATASATLTPFTALNGSGSVGAGQRNTNGTITTVPASGTGTYTVTSGGAITVGTGGQGISGAVSADGDLLVLAPITSNGNGSTPGIYVAVKQGSGVTAATLNGVYTLVSLSTSTATGTVGRYYSVGIANGVLGGAYIENNSGTSTNSIAITGTYTAAADGTMTAVLTGSTVSSTLTGAMSADGNVFVLADLTSSEAATLLVGIRQ
jgi:beta-lactam-binding protein with PASTA domain